MLVNSIPFQRPELDTTSQFSKVVPINLEHLRTWTCLISNHNAQKAQLKAIIQDTVIATQYSKPWVVVSIFIHPRISSKPLGGGNAERNQKKRT